MLRSPTMAERGGRATVLAVAGVGCLVLVVLLGLAVGPRASGPDRDIKRVLRSPLDEPPYRRAVRTLASETAWPYASYAMAVLPGAVAAALLAHEVWLRARPAVFGRWRWLLPALAALPLQHALRVAFWRSGPKVPLWSEGARGAYPSGAAVLVALGWAVGVVVVGDLRPRWRPIGVALGVAALGLHAVARVTAQKHWATDILGSYLLAAGALLLAAAFASRPAAGR